MRRLTTDFLLAVALWVLGLLAYAGALGLPWFTLERTVGMPAPRLGRQGEQFQVTFTGADAFEFLQERLQGGSFVWLAHPMLWTGWLFLVCRRWRAATAAGCIALVLALNVPLVFQPREGPWLPPGVGYYLWFASMALLACSSCLRNCFFSSDPAADHELAAQQRTLAAELAELKQQVAGLVDQQALTFLEEFDSLESSETGRA